ncbi:MAG: hypothetical protein AAGJ40_09660 [Planctomycetota bacterium]
MPVKLSDIIASQNNGAVSGISTSSEVVAAEVPITPDPAISLDADDVAGAVNELASDLHGIENMPSLSLDYTLQRNS